MRILICGIDGYIGWPLALHFKKLKHEVMGIDNGSRRARVDSAIPIGTMHERATLLKTRLDVEHMDTAYIGQVLKDFKPDIIYHLAQMPSAPYSMASKSKCLDSYAGNTLGCLNLLWAMKDYAPKAHLVKLGTMGEYGTPNIPIMEGVFSPDAFMASIPPGTRPTTSEMIPLDGLPLPRQPGSFYHASKVADSINCELAARVWGLRISNIMQGIVVGTWAPGIDSPEKATRFDVDETFGTVVNRFVAQAILGIPLTVYGKGGQTRGYLPLDESIQCLSLVGFNPGGDRVEYYNQFGQIWSVKDLATKVLDIAQCHFGIHASSQHVDNPRVEAEEHNYDAANGKLKYLGYKPAADLDQTIIQMFQDLAHHKDTLEGLRDSIMPRTNWR